MIKTIVFLLSVPLAGLASTETSPHAQMNSYKAYHFDSYTNMPGNAADTLVSDEHPPRTGARALVGAGEVVYAQNYTATPELPPSLAALTDGTKSVFLKSSQSVTMRTLATAKIGAVGWLEEVVPLTESIATLSVMSPSGLPALVTASRTSHGGGGPGGQAAFTQGIFTINDNILSLQQSYGIYLEAQRRGAAGSVEGLEISIGNSGNAVFVNPFTVGTSGETIGILLGAGLNGLTVDATAAIAMQSPSPTGPRFRSGIIFGSNSLAKHSDAYPYPIAIDMIQKHTIMWRDAVSGAPLNFIRADANAPGQGGNIIFTIDGIALSGAGGATISLAGTAINVSGELVISKEARFQSDTLFNGKVHASGMLQFNGDGPARAAGVEIGQWYINKATGAVTQRRM